MNVKNPYILMIYDASLLGFCMFISIFISFFIIKPFKDKLVNFKLSLSLGLSVLLLSLLMMHFSGKYYNKPIQNTESKTFWTWWKIK